MLERNPVQDVELLEQRKESLEKEVFLRGKINTLYTISVVFNILIFTLVITLDASSSAETFILVAVLGLVMGLNISLVLLSQSIGRKK